MRESNMILLYHESETIVQTEAKIGEKILTWAYVSKIRSSMTNDIPIQIMNSQAASEIVLHWAIKLLSCIDMSPTDCIQ